MKMKKGIVLIVALLFLMTIVYAEEDIPTPPGDIAGGCHEPLPCDMPGGVINPDVVTPTVDVQLVDNNQIVRAIIEDNIGVRQIKFFHGDSLQETRDISPAQTDVSEDFILSVYGITLQSGNVLRVNAFDGYTIGTKSLTYQPTPSGTGPTVTISLSPLPTNGISSGTVTVHAEATDIDGVDRFVLYIDNSVFPPQNVITGSDIVDSPPPPAGGCNPPLPCDTGGGSPEPTLSPQQDFILDTTRLSDGTHTIKVQAFDNNQNEGWSAPLTINVQNAPLDDVEPSVQVVSLKVGEKVFGPMDKFKEGDTIHVTAQADDEKSGIEKIQFSYKGTRIGPDFPASDSKIYEIDILIVGTGVQAIKVVAYDKAGNWKDTEISIEVEGVVVQTPIIEIDFPEGATVQEGTILTTLTSAAVKSVDFFYDCVPPAACIPKATLSTPPYSFTLTGVGAAGLHRVRAVAKDSSDGSGVEIGSDEVGVTVVAVPPSGTLSSSGTTSGGGGSSTRTYKNYLQTRGTKRDTDVVPQRQSPPPQQQPVQPIFSAPVANPVVPAPRIEPIQLEQPIQQYQPPVEEEPIQLWVIIVTSVGVLLLLAGVVVLLLKRRVPQEVVSYIKSSIEQGYSPDVLEQSLVEQGWSQKIVQKAMRGIQNV